MADAGQQAVDYGVNTGAGMAARAILGRSVPLPDFYNPNSPNHFGDSQFGQMLHGNGAAWRGYGRRAARTGLNTGAAIATGGLSSLYQLGTGLWNMVMPDRLDIPQQYTSVGNFLVRDPTPTVGGSPATPDGNGNMVADGITYDPWTGEQLSNSNGLANYMPNFTGGTGYSPQGPYAGGYQGLPQDDPGGGQDPTMPNFDMGDQYSGARDANGNPTWDPSADQNGDGRLNPSERRDASDWQLHGPSAFGSGVTNFMVGGSPVITGYRPAGGDMNQMATYNGRDWGG